MSIVRYVFTNDYLTNITSIDIVVRNRVQKCYIWVNTIICTISGYMLKKIDALETWFDRIMLRTSWKLRITNEEVYSRTHTHTHTHHY